eukprot:TRINITY_DN3498_c0_g2_i3.p1 TRINITY_DN3498_c0_g2~~TRINITY_DN3498_c0_g2_i3.p1  ORF type:complete len:1779 (-),score=388.08 TRINITY_DN3498_c0_g2_i3:198-5534(-)
MAGRVATAALPVPQPLREEQLKPRAKTADFLTDSPIFDPGQRCYSDGEIPTRQRKDTRTIKGILAGLSEMARSLKSSLFGAQSAEDFWLEYLKSAELVLDLPLDKGNRDISPGTSMEAGPIGFLNWTIPIPFEFRSISPNLMPGDETTAAVLLLYTAWISLLGRMARSTEFVNGFGVESGHMPDLFPSQTVPMCVNLTSADGQPASALALFSGLQQEVERLRAILTQRGSVQYDALTRALGLNESDESAHAIFQTAFIVGPHFSEQKEMERAAHIVGSGAPVFLQLRVKPPLAGARALSLQLLYWHDVFSVDSASHLHSQLNVLFGGLAGQRGQLTSPIQELPGVTKLQEVTLKQWSDKTDYRTYNPGQMHEQFVKEAQMQPNRPCLVDCKEDGREDKYTYGDFLQLARQLQQALQHDYGVGLDDMVPLLFDRGVHMLTAVYGVLMAGGAYVPLEPHYPAGRIVGIIEQVHPRVCLTVPKLGEALSPAKLRPENGLVWPVLGLGEVERHGGKLVLPLAELYHSPKRPQEQVLASKHAENRRKQEGGHGLVYVFFTSGSTGKPKGVMCEHAGLRHRIEWMQNRYALQPGEATVLKHAYTFGISEWEMFWPLAVGSILVIPKPGGEKEPDYIFDLCARHPVTVMYMVPSMLNMLLDNIQAEDKDPVESGFQLRQVITCGEALKEDTIQQHFRLLHEAELDNLYGPTEGSMTVWRCPRGQGIPQVPIGVPIAGIRVYALAGDGGVRLAEVNNPGEIYFAGLFIARGYLGLPGQTAQVFLRDTVMPSEYPGERMYKTGDLACWKPNGQLTFLGRADTQIKLRGFRIEIGEIEAVVRGAAGVKDATVILAGEGESKFLAAYAAPLSVDLDTLRASCTAKLPHYMVPSTFMKLSQLPVTDRGKLDKKALPKPQLDGQVAKTGDANALVPPRNLLETTIVAIIAEVLGKDPGTIGIESDFVSLGGNSVLAGKVTSRLRKTFSLPLPGTTLYKRPTPAQLAQLITEMREKLGIGDSENSEDDPLASEVEPPKQRWKGMSSTRPAAVALTAFMPVLDVLSSLSDLTGFIEVVLMKILADRFNVDVYDVKTLVIIVVLLNFVLEPVLLLFDLIVALFIKYALIGKLKPGAYSVFSGDYFRWLYCTRVMGGILSNFEDYFIGTPVINMVYRCFGAKIGRGVVINTKEVFIEPELVTIEDGAFIDDESKVTCHSIGDGQLFLHPVHIGRHARLRPYSAVGRGASVPAGHELVSTSCLVGYGGKQEGFVVGGKMSKLPMSKAVPPKTQPCLRMCVGIPLLFIIDALAMVPEYLLSVYLIDFDWIPYMLVMAIVGEHVHRAALVTLTVLTKWLLVGKVKPGPRKDESAWSGMCSWVVQTLLERDSFKEALEGYINTEVLRFVFVLLGAKIGRRANMDMISCDMPDLLSIGDYMLFGSKVGIVCHDEDKRKPVQICRGANVLDNCVLCPGVTVGQRAVLGTNTLAAPGQYFPPETINTGNKGGRAVFLRKKGKGTAQTVGLEAEANRRLDSIVVWTLFNIGLCLMALLEPALRAVKTFPFMVAVVLPWGTGAIVATTIVLMALEEFIEAGLLWLLKWCVIGRFKERDVVFFGIDHFLWMCWLMVSSTFKHLDGFHGTALYSAFLRAMGAKVGRDCTLFGFTLEFDLLSIGDCVNVGIDCDNTCHTVENMVLKMVPVTLGSYSTMQRHSFVMPGAELGEGATLFEESQILKGEIVPADEIWAGNPAEPLKARSRERLWNVPRLNTNGINGKASNKVTNKIQAPPAPSLQQPLLA